MTEHPNPPNPTEITRDQALLWLNDRLGQEVYVDVFLNLGDISPNVLTVLGTLRHWSDPEHTIGGMMVFPENRIGRNMTINGARGFHPRIKDRFDLTLECIRRRYLDEPSPLSATLARYADFFGLFGDFPGYVDFSHLQDLVNEVTLTVKFSLPFEDFTASPLPGTLDAYFVYRQRAIEFIESRNRRIAAHVGAEPLMNSPP